MKKDIDLDKTVSTDEVMDIEDTVRGAIMLINGLVLSEDSGTHIYQSEGYQALNIILSKAVSDIDKLKDGINYMQDVIRSKN